MRPQFQNSMEARYSIALSTHPVPVRHSGESSGRRELSDDLADLVPADEWSSEDERQQDETGANHLGSSPSGPSSGLQRPIQTDESGETDKSYRKS